MGWNLEVAEYRDVYLTEQDLWRYVQQFLVHSKHTTTYKHILMKAILESLPETDDSGRVEFLVISRHVAKIYWNLVIKYGLRQINSTKSDSGIEEMLKGIQREFQIPSDWHFDKIPQDVQGVIIRKTNAVYKRYVYGSFYSSFNGTIYSFDKKQEWIKLNPPYIVFLERYKRIIVNLTNYQLALFLEKFNESEKVEHILDKVEFVSMRQSLKEFYQLLIAYGDERCFYCHKPKKTLHVDHFVPWSYVQNDMLWNFVFACPSCNSSKSNKLAHSMFLTRLLERNDGWRDFEQMQLYRDDKLITMYNYAIGSGFVHEWVPK